MKNLFYLLFFLFLGVSCTTQKNSKDFINETTGRYLFNANEVIEIYFEEDIMHAKWRGNDDIKLLKVNDSSFYMKALNEKMVFVSQPEMHIELAEKTEHKGVKYYFKKMAKGDKTPLEYFENKEYDKALIAYQLIQKNDSLNPIIRQRTINSLGYNYLRENNFEKAVETFKINTVLYPNSSNVYDSLADAYLRTKDTLKAINYYKKALRINPENRSSQRMLKKITKK